MKKLIITIIFISPTFVIGQTIKSYLNTASFYTSEDIFLETYLAFDANSLSLSKNNGKFYAEIDILIEITKNTIPIYTDHYLLISPIFEGENNLNLFFFDQQRITLKNGNYKLKVTVADTKGDTVPVVHLKDILINYNKMIEISDIQLVSEYSEQENESKITKSSLKITPFVSNYYPKNINTLSYYFEVYNTHKVKKGKYLLNTYIETFTTNVPLFDFNKIKRESGKKINSSLFSFDISELPTGNYNLVCEIKDFENHSITKKKLFFQRSNSFSGVQKEEDISGVLVASNFLENIKDKELLKLYIDYLYPISSAKENTFAQNQIKYNNLELMQKFFYNFWKNKNPTDPYLAWCEYYQKVTSVNKKFKNFKIAGYLTDRGRVYLQYGAPNSIHTVENAASTYPYEIWHYYKLKNQTNKKFVFINSDFATNEYRLEYSNVYGEVSNAEWRDKINQDLSPTFGDDFNNNYLNPR